MYVFPFLLIGSGSGCCCAISSESRIWPSSVSSGLGLLFWNLLAVAAFHWHAVQRAGRTQPGRSLAGRWLLSARAVGRLVGGRRLGLAEQRSPWRPGCWSLWRSRWISPSPRCSGVCMRFRAPAGLVTETLQDVRKPSQRQVRRLRRLSSPESSPLASLRFHIRSGTASAGQPPSGACHPAHAQPARACAQPIPWELPPIDPNPGRRQRGQLSTTRSTCSAAR